MIHTFVTSFHSHSLKHNFIWALTISILFSSFIYLEHYFVTIKILNTLTALGALALMLYATKRTILFAGFFIGIFWFYWIGYSFEYQGVGYMTPIITIVFGFVYLLFFGVLALTEKIYIRALLLFGLSFIEPFDWNWMQIELLFIESFIGIEKYQLIFVLLAISLPHYIQNQKRYLQFIPLLLLVFSLDYSKKNQEESKLHIKLIQTNIKQEDKWKKESLLPTVQLIISEIKTAIKEGYDIVVFPESVFPLFMNKNPNLLKKLLPFSKNITIVAGSLSYENNKSYNVTYMMQDEKFQVAKKLVLVPFGEYIPLPKFAQDFINETFFAGQSDFHTATAPTDFLIQGEKFRNAICYEATCQEIYEGDVKYLIASSNNAWFAPSIEPTLQNLLMRYYARKNGVTIYHSANYKGTGIIK